MQKQITTTPRPRLVDYVCLDYGIAAMGTKGASVHLRSICRALRAEGCNVRLVCTRIGGDIPVLKNFVNSVHEVELPQDMRRMQKSLRQVFGPGMKIPPELRQSLINRDAPGTFSDLWRRRKPKLIVERLSLFGVGCVRAAKAATIPHVLEVNALLSEEARAFRSLNDYEAARAAEDEALVATDSIFAVSEKLRDMIVERGINPAKIHVLPNAYDETQFRAMASTAVRKELEIGGSFTVGFVGSLKSWHGVQTLLEAFRTFAGRKDVVLLIVGDGPEGEKVRAFMTSHPELKVLAVGATAHERIPLLISACDVCVAPYEDSEAFYFSPMKVYEYMAMAKPVIASNQGQLTSLIQHGKNGLLFPAGNAPALGRMLQKLYNTPDLRKAIGRNASKSVRPYTWRNNARRILQVVDTGG